MAVLMAASSSGDADLAAGPIAAGTDIETLNPDRQASLNVAMPNDHDAVVRLLSVLSPDTK